MAVKKAFSMFGLFKKKQQNKTEKEKLAEAFSKIKSEMNDHLEAINESTDELNLQQADIEKLEAMISKVSERLDDIELKVSSLSGKKAITTEEFRNIILTQKEKEVFLLLYSRTGDLLDFREISKALGITEELARKHVAAMISKGIPIIKKYFEERTCLILDSDFRNLQAKENVLGIKGY